MVPFDFGGGDKGGKTGENLDAGKGTIGGSPKDTDSPAGKDRAMEIVKRLDELASTPEIEGLLKELEQIAEDEGSSVEDLLSEEMEEGGMDSDEGKAKVALYTAQLKSKGA